MFPMRNADGAVRLLTQINAKFCGWDLLNRLAERLLNAAIQDLNLKKRKLSCLELALA